MGMRISTSHLPARPIASRMMQSRFSAFRRERWSRFSPAYGITAVDTDALQTLIILPERLYAYDCTVPTAPEADKLQIEA